MRRATYAHDRPPVTTADVNAAGTSISAHTKATASALRRHELEPPHVHRNLDHVPGSRREALRRLRYDNAGTATLNFLAWTNDTTRSTALTTQDGVYVKSGAVTRRYLGTFYTGNVSQTWDSVAFRYLWNYYNRVRKPMRDHRGDRFMGLHDGHISAGERGSTANQLDFIVGVTEDGERGGLCVLQQLHRGGVGAVVGIGLDSTTTLATGCLTGSSSNGGANYFATANCVAKTSPTAGHHTLAWLEYSAATGTTTWYGDNGAPTISQSGIHGEIWA
jgi:hypothetical protein